jgi:serine/threonine protein phosphatase PrpC
LFARIVELGAKFVRGRLGDERIGLAVNTKHVVELPPSGASDLERRICVKNRAGLLFPDDEMEASCVATVLVDAGSINMSRVVGSLLLSTGGVTPEPEAMRATLAPGDKIVIFSDGVCLDDSAVSLAAWDTAGVDKIAESLCLASLKERAMTGTPADNVTAVVVHVQSDTKQE